MSASDCGRFELSSSEINQDEFKWGDWDKEPSKRGRMWLLVLSLSVIGAFILPVAFEPNCFHFWRLPCDSQTSCSSVVWWGIGVLYASLGLGSALFSKHHFRLDRIKADSSGLALTYSYTPRTLDDYVVVRTILSWAQIAEIVPIDVEGEGGHEYAVVIKLRTSLVSGQVAVEFDRPDNGSMFETIERLERYRTGADSFGGNNDPLPTETGSNPRRDISTLDCHSFGITASWTQFQPVPNLGNRES